MSGTLHRLVGIAAVVLCSIVASAASASEATTVRDLLASWRIAEAGTALQQLRAKGGAPALLAELEGNILFYSGRYKEALAKLRLARRLGASSRRLRDLQRLVQATQKTVERFIERRSKHFVLRLRPGRDELLIPFAIETLEAMYSRLKEDLGFAPDHPLVVEVYAEPEDLARVSPLLVGDIKRTGTVALCKYNRLMIVTPRALVRGYGWRDTLAHEYTHYVVNRVSAGQAPIWFHEGLAKYFETRWRMPADSPPALTPVQEHLLASALRGKRRLVRWSEMHPSMAKLPDQLTTALAFAQVQLAVSLLARDHKASILRSMLHSLRNGRSVWKSLERLAGLSAKQFSRAFTKHLRSLKLRRHRGLIPPRKQYGKSLSREQRMTAIRDKRARDLFRLADMLRQRKLTRAAIIEYEKARAALGPRDPLIANALARAQLEVGNPTQAVNVLLPVLEFYPELPGQQVTIGLAYLHSGNREAAAQHLQVALRINPFSPELHCALARVLRDKAADRHARLCSALGP